MTEGGLAKGAIISITDLDRYEEYARLAPELVARFGGTGGGARS